MPMPVSTCLAGRLFRLPSASLLNCSHSRLVGWKGRRAFAGKAVRLAGKAVRLQAGFCWKDRQACGKGSRVAEEAGRLLQERQAGLLETQSGFRQPFAGKTDRLVGKGVVLLKRQAGLLEKEAQRLICWAAWQPTMSERENNQERGRKREGVVQVDLSFHAVQAAKHAQSGHASATSHTGM